MIALDTNVLTRFFVNDHPRQARQARQLIEQHSVYVSSTVLLESAWVLKSAYDRPSAIIVRLLRDFLHRVARHNGVIGETGEAGVVRDFLAVQLQASAPGREIALLLGGIEVRAEIGPAGDALPARAATRRKDENDVIADDQICDTLAERCDLAGSLVPDDGRQWPWPRALDGREIRMAEPGRPDLDQHLAGTRPL